MAKYVHVLILYRLESALDELESKGSWVRNVAERIG